MMKLVAIACVVVVATAVVHNDEWCHEHHLGSGSASCVKWTGCCYSELADTAFDGTQELGPCHSCERHMDSWCAIFGGTDLDSCLVHSGCTYDSDTSACKSAKPEPLSVRRTCYAHFEDATVEKQAYSDCIAAVEDPTAKPNEICESSYAYEPKCVADDADYYQAKQDDIDGIGVENYFCVDKNGHEIPDTRKESPLNIWHINCDKKRSESLGYQCPNAITLTTKGGVVVVNQDNDATDCKIHCNTDKDCTGADGQWCCFNGCGYTCKLPVLPMSGCAEVPANPVQTVTGLEGGSGHGVEIALECAQGYDVIPVTKPQKVTLTCKHGHWETLDGRREYQEDVKCEAKCAQFDITGVSAIDGRPLRSRDFTVTGAENRWSTAEVTIGCKPGYGVVAGTQRSKDSGVEKVSCTDGQWKNTVGEERTIECSVCYDAYSHEWRDEKGNACDYYATRPMECNSNSGARENCRVSCRSCMEAEQAHKVRNTRNDLLDIAEAKRTNWRRVRKKIANTRTRTITETKQVEVTVELAMNEVCTDGAGTNIRKPAAGCPPGYSPMA